MDCEILLFTRRCPTEWDMENLPVPKTGAPSAWLDDLRSSPDMHVERIAFGKCSPWSLRDNAICRSDSRFFSLSSPDRIHFQIEQPEIALQAFALVQSTGDPQILLHAKDEPGNLYLTQISPTIQATKSNFERVHGGQETPMMDAFFKCGQVLSDSLHSEHSSHFWRKRNRNAMVVLPPAQVELNDRLRLFFVRDFLSMCLTDHAINTDARSVLATAPWEALTSRRPFERNAEGFGKLLRDGYEAEDEADVAMEFLASHRKPHSAVAATRTPLQLDANSMSWGVSDKIHFIEVSSRTREVKKWRQPIFVPHADDLQVLLCRHGATGIEFLLRVEQSEALLSTAEFAPTFCGASDVSLLAARPEPVAVLHQTDEGGRFWQATCRYEIRLLAPGDLGEEIAATVQPACWVNMRQLQRLAATELTTTNELRTLVSMLLYWL